MDPNSCNELAEVIQQIDGAERVQTQKISSHCKDMLSAVDAISNASPERIDSIVNELQRDRSGVYTEFVDRRPYISLALSFAYCKKNESALAQKFAQEGTEQFSRAFSKSSRSKAEWNRAVAHWFLGIMYRNNGEVGKDKAELVSSLMLFATILKNLNDSTTKVRSDYELARACKVHIASIQATIDYLPNFRARSQTMNRTAIPYQVFSEVIGQVEIPDNEIHSEWLQRVYLLEPSDLPSVREQIDFCVDILNHEQGVQEPITIPLANIFLAHCYMLGYFASAADSKSLSYAIRYLEDASAIFHSQGAHRNEALAKWYLALIYQRLLDPEKGLAMLSEAADIVEGLWVQEQDQDIYEDLQRIQTEIQSWINPMPPLTDLPSEIPHAPRPAAKSKKDFLPPLSWLGSKRTSKLSPPQPTQFRKRAFVTAQPRLSTTENKKPEDGPPPKKQEASVLPKDRSPRQHIVIPIDVQTLRDLNTDSVPLESSLFMNLRDYQDRTGSDNARETPGVDPSPEPPPVKPPRIPSFPILGQVAAGPEGRPNLESEDQAIADPVFEDLCINFNRRQYNIRFLERQKYNFVSSKSYGWLMVSGESMNNFSPVKIMDGDYVLFVENRNIDSCVFKAVVAELLDRDLQPVQLVVKQLLKLSTSFPSRTDGFSPEYSKYVLHSESSAALDTNTGETYKDIEIARDNQIVGEVIAVASPASLPNHNI